MSIAAMCVLLAGLFATCGSATEEGLVVWYSFEEAADNVVRDASGSGVVNSGSWSTWHESR